MLTERGKMESIVFACSRDRFTNIITISILIIIFAVNVSVYVAISRNISSLVAYLIIFATTLPILGVLFYVPLKYTLTTETLIINRLGPDKIVALNEIINVSSLDNDMIRGSLKLFANGGLGGYVGLYSNKKLGKYKAHLTRRNNLVLIELENEKYVISPDEPERFVDAFNKLQKKTP
jgi:hypothetical protein